MRKNIIKSFRLGDEALVSYSNNCLHSSIAICVPGKHGIFSDGYRFHFCTVPSSKPYFTSTGYMYRPECIEMDRELIDLVINTNDIQKIFSKAASLYPSPMPLPKLPSKSNETTPVTKRVKLPAMQLDLFGEIS